MEWWVAGLALVIGLLILIVIGLPVAVSLGCTSIIFLVMSSGYIKMLSIVGMEFFRFWTG